MADTTDRELELAKERWLAERLQKPVPMSVRFDRSSAMIVVTFANNASFMVPARALEGLEDASDAQLNDVELLGETGLHWESLDIDYTISGLMSGIFGTKAFMDAQRKGGQSRSPAKIAASRTNGAKGGRPRKVLSPS